MFAVASTRTETGADAIASIRRELKAHEQQIADLESQLRVAVRNPEFVRPDSAKRIAATVAELHHMKLSDLVGVSRTKAIVAVRDAAIRAVADARPDMSTPAIGRVFNRDHTTIIHSLRKTRKAGQAR